MLSRYGKTSDHILDSDLDDIAEMVRKNETNESTAYYMRGAVRERYARRCIARAALSMPRLVPKPKTNDHYNRRHCENSR